MHHTDLGLFARQLMLHYATAVALLERHHSQGRDGDGSKAVDGDEDADPSANRPQVGAVKPKPKTSWAAHTVLGFAEMLWTRRSYKVETVVWITGKAWGPYCRVHTSTSGTTKHMQMCASDQDI